MPRTATFVAVLAFIASPCAGTRKGSPERVKSVRGADGASLLQLTRDLSAEDAQYFLTDRAMADVLVGAEKAEMDAEREAASAGVEVARVRSPALRTLGSMQKEALQAERAAHAERSAHASPAARTLGSMQKEALHLEGSAHASPAAAPAASPAASPVSAATTTTPPPECEPVEPVEEKHEEDKGVMDTVWGFFSDAIEWVSEATGLKEDLPPCPTTPKPPVAAAPSPAAVQPAAPSPAGAVTAAPPAQDPAAQAVKDPAAQPVNPAAPPVKDPAATPAKDPADKTVPVVHGQNPHSPVAPHSQKSSNETPPKSNARGVAAHLVVASALIVSAFPLAV